MTSDNRKSKGRESEVERELEREEERKKEGREKNRERDLKGRKERNVLKRGLRTFNKKNATVETGDYTSGKTACACGGGGLIEINSIQIQFILN